MAYVDPHFLCFDFRILHGNFPQNQTMLDQFLECFPKTKWNEQDWDHRQHRSMLVKDLPSLLILRTFIFSIWEHLIYSSHIWAKSRIRKKRGASDMSKRPTVLRYDVLSQQTEFDFQSNSYVSFAIVPTPYVLSRVDKPLCRFPKFFCRYFQKTIE